MISSLERGGSRMAEESTFSLCQDGRFEVNISLFKNVKGASEVKKKVLKGQIQAAAVRPSMICSCFSIVVAANKAIHSSLHEKMKTRGIHTEVIYNLSPSHNISESLKKFGIQDNDTSLLLICIYEKGVGNNVEGYFNEVDGTQCHIEELKNFADVNALKQLYKVTEEELKIGTLSDAIVCRIATKDVS